MNINHLLNTNPQTPGVVFSQSALKVEESRVAGQSADVFTLSDEASRLISQDKKTDTSLSGSGKGTGQGTEQKVGQNTNSFEDKESDKSELQATESDDSLSTESQLSEAELLEVEELQRRDTEVRAHEQAHTSAAGNLAQGGASFDYQTGPDGNRYAVGGEVSIDTAAVAGDPQATLTKAQKIRRAATAPVDPSAQDRSVAAQASRLEAEARTELSQQLRDNQIEYIDENTPEIDFLGQQSDQNEKNIQNTYSQIQNAGILQEQKSFVDFFI